MNNLQTTNNGGFPFVLDDIRFIEAAINDCFKGGFSCYGVDSFANSFIISGCVVTGGPTTYNCSAGYICLKGEVMPVDAHTVPNPGVGQIRYWDIVETNDAAGQKTFEDLTIVNTYIIRKATIVVGTAPVDYLAVDVTLLIPSTSIVSRMWSNLDSLRKFARIAQESWHEVGALGEPSFSDSWANFAPLLAGVCKFYKNEFGDVVISGGVSSGDIGSTKSVFTLPTGYRPAAAVWKSIPIYDVSNSEKGMLLIEILNNGKVCPKEIIYSSGAITDPKINLGHISFSTL